MKSGRNKTITIEKVMEFEDKYKKEIAYEVDENIENKVINMDCIEAMKKMPDSCVDLLIVDPPYNLSKTYDQGKFSRRQDEEYMLWFESWVKELPRLMKPNGSLYFCGDWKSSPLYYPILSKYFKIQNRITWEREKGRGAKTNWKNNIEDVYFCTMQDKDYTFNIDDVKVKKTVIAPYKDSNGNAKDWFEENGKKYRYTHPSNIWTDMTVPYWSMSENTEHPTQKPEKLMAKLIVASSNEGDMVFDPFCGSGTTLVAAKKLNRRYCGVELQENYCMLTQHRLELAETNKQIQGYKNGEFLARNE